MIKDIKLQGLDDYHWNGNRLLSYNKTYNFVCSGREPGKTTWIILYMLMNLVKKQQTFFLVKRRIAGITETYLTDLQRTINKFSTRKVHLEYRKGALKEGMMDVYVVDDEDDDKQFFFRIGALNVDSDRRKGQVCPNISWMWMDEFIINPRNRTRISERYLPDEFIAFRELYDTLRREAEKKDISKGAAGLRCLFSGNPYSLFNPYWTALNVDTQKLIPGTLLAPKDTDYAVELYQMSDKLREEILRTNPNTKIEDPYAHFALEGVAINDINFRLKDKQPDNFRLQFAVYLKGKYLLIYINNNLPGYEDLFYWCECLTDYTSKRRNITCFDINDLIAGTKLFDIYTKANLCGFKAAFGSRKVAFKTIEEAYLAEELFTYL